MIRIKMYHIYNKSNKKIEEIINTDINQNKKNFTNNTKNEEYNKIFFNGKNQQENTTNNLSTISKEQKEISKSILDKIESDYTYENNKNNTNKILLSNNINNSNINVVNRIIKKIKHYNDNDSLIESDNDSKESKIKNPVSDNNSEKNKKLTNKNEIINNFKKTNIIREDPKTLTKSVYSLYNHLGSNKNKKDYETLNLREINNKTDDKYNKSIDTLNDLLNRTNQERIRQKDLHRKKIINTKRIKGYSDGGIKNQIITKTYKDLGLLKEKINKEITVELESFIPISYLELIKRINLPYWFNPDKTLNKLYLTDFYNVIKYSNIITNILQNNNNIKTRYIESADDTTNNTIFSLERFY